MFQRISRYFSNASAWLVIGMSLILAIVVIGLAVMNYNRERQYMGKILSEKGASLIRAFEAGARTGMMGAFGTLPRLDTLIKETADQPDIIYIAIVDSTGEILAHNDSAMVGKAFIDEGTMDALEAGKEVKWRTIGDDSLSAFEVYKLFLPVIPDSPQSQMMSMMQQRMKMMSKRMEMQNGAGWMQGMPQDKLLHPESRPVIVIGMDTASFKEAINEDIKMTLVISGILLLLGVAGVVSLFWAQSYTRSRKLLSDINAISSEMINNLPEGVILTDNNLNIRYLNKNAEMILGVSARDVIGHTPEQTLPTPITALDVSESGNDQVLEKEISIERPGGHALPASVIATEVVTTDGMFVGHMYILKDLSQIKQLQLEVQKKDKLAVIGNLAAGVAHEVRNPLSSIKGYASYFKTLFAEDSENRAAAEVLVNETERLNRVITELLEISRPSDIKLQEVDIQMVFDTTLRLIHSDANQLGNIEISLDISDDLKNMVIDADRFVQVLMNVYLNSIQAMPDGGALSTTVVSKNDHIEIVITDTGTGMTEDTRRQLFNPYFTTKTTGTGLGMAIVHKIIEAHKGEIRVVSKEGNGTEITICVPKSKNDTPT
jgi:two-component system sensor histidine kinase HydH